MMDELRQRKARAVWQIYGLSIEHPVWAYSDTERREEVLRCGHSHDLVADYLLRHPDVEKEWFEHDKVGALVGYYDILFIAEKEEREENQK